MPYIENERARLYWTEKGSGPPVLLIMGLSFTHEMWFRTLPALVGYRAILFDNRGMGRSSIPSGPYSIRQMARDAQAVLRAAGVNSAHILGASMGGMIAQELALLYPESVHSLVLACTSFSGMFGKWPDFRRTPRWSPWTKVTSEEREYSLRHLLHADSAPMDRIEEDIRIRLACNRSQKGFFYQFAGILMWNAYTRLPKINAPTLVIHGDQDRLIPPVNGRIVAERIPGARFELVHDAGHILTTDQPELCQNLLMQFLAEQAASGPSDCLSNFAEESL